MWLYFFKLLRCKAIDYCPTVDNHQFWQISNKLISFYSWGDKIHNKNFFLNTKHYKNIMQDKQTPSKIDEKITPKTYLKLFYAKTWAKPKPIKFDTGEPEPNLSIIF